MRAEYSVRMPAPKRQNKGGKKPAAPKGPRGWRPLFGGPNFLGNLITVIIIFLLLMSVYSLIANFTAPSNEIPLSQVASDVEAGKVNAITVSGDALDLTYTDGSQKSSQKDSAAGLPETLATYGVTPEELSKVSLTVSSQNGFTFWLITLSPIILPLIFIGLLFWFLSRQVRGAGMQAFTFGQSKARVI